MLNGSDKSPQLGGQHADGLTGAEPELSGARMPKPGDMVAVFIEFPSPNRPNKGMMIRADTSIPALWISYERGIIDDGTPEGINYAVARVMFKPSDVVFNVPLKWVAYGGRLLD